MFVAQASPAPEPIPDIRDIVDPVQVLDPRLVLISLTLASLVAFVLLTWLIVSFFKRSRRTRPPSLPESPTAAATVSLSKLRDSAPSLSPAEIATSISGIVDTFLHRQHGIPALYRTTDELARQRPGDPPPLPAITHFSPLLKQLEALKFSSPNRRQEQAESLVEQALSLIKSTPAP